MTRLHVVNGQGVTPEARADAADMERQSFVTEARQLSKAMRFLALQTRLWTPEELAKALTHAADRVEARWTDPEKAA